MAKKNPESPNENKPVEHENKPEVYSEAKSSIDEDYELSSFEKDYVKVRKLFDEGWKNSTKYVECAEECEPILKDLIINIIDKNHRKLWSDQNYKQKFDEIYGDAQKGKLEEQELKKICELIDDEEVKYFQLAGENYAKHSPLLKSFKFGEIASLIDYCKVSGTSDIGRKLATQQILNSITSLLLARRQDLQIEPFHLLANYEHLRMEIKRIEDNHKKLNNVRSEMFYVLEEDENRSDTREFEWLKFRGMLINTNDQSRNIAFKVETFNNILSSIYHGIEREIRSVIHWCRKEKPKDEKEFDQKLESLSQIPKKIILDAGYLSGLNFGWTMHEIIQRENESLALIEKIERWCDFDSDVGFGKLELIKENIPDDFESTKEKSFEIKLSDNFVVYKRDKDDVNLCSFIAGYIQGVLEKVVQTPLTIQHKPSLNQCEQFQQQQNFCIFLVKTDLKKMEEIRSEVNEKYKYDLKPSSVQTERK